MTRQPLCRIKSLPSVFNNSPSSPTFACAERLAEPHQRSSRAKSAVHSRSHADRDGVASHSRQQSPKAKTGEKSKNNKGQKGQKDQEDVKEWKASPIHVKEWKASPIHELLPPEVCKQVHQAAPKGGVVIEIQWSSTEYLPEHKGGKKYYEYAERLQELLKERFGDRLPVHVLDKPIRCKRRTCCVLAKAFPNQGGLYDTFSDCERDLTLVHSNRSHASAVASRVGAFEVHLIGNPNLCSGELSGNEEHGGPAIYGSWGICCFACAQRNGGPKDDEKKLCQRHRLLHSKLWTRRWPAIATLVGRIEALVIQPPPTIMPVPLRHVPFKREQCPSLPSAFANRSMVTMLTVSDSDRRPAILKDLASLLSLKCSNCPHEDWQIAGGIGTGRQQADADSDTLSACRCGHTLNFHEISSMLRSYHLFSASQLGNSWRDLRDAGWRGRRLDIFISRFVEVQHAADNEHRKLQEELVQKFLKLRESFVEEEKVLRDEYADEFERGQVEVEKIYVELCLDLVAKIPEHGFDLSRLERAEATASEAQEKLTEAIELNKTRESNLKKWLSEVDLEVWETIRKQRPDLDRWVAGQKEETAVLDTYIESCQEKMLQVTKQHDRKEIYQASIYDLIVQFESQLGQFRQELGL